ncbi:amino acid adenylation domain-containing protein [Streptomyces alfalfae]|uniref:amino acid adenylation domain-containing SDR family oxidoreductase n=1 Tax=Streptomyces alfalfae TaxID=1642299 RepID=UPI001BAC4B51|nr:amino acid adenylation domain-containing SDR family oxidoreductase [Streptomyces alfalfae]QUI35368.1 amino acid adenylation domain-containing protein [Streptomyces alfalfae]
MATPDETATAALPRHARSWNQAPTDHPRAATIPLLFTEQADARPEAAALEWADGTWSYGELAVQVRRGATALRAHGVGAGDVVAVVMRRSPAAVATILAILHAGGVYLPLGPDQPADRLTRILRDAGVRVAVHCADEPVEVPDPTIAVCADDLFNVPEDADPHWWRDRAADEAAYVIYTSGSTGAPKGVVCPHRGQTRLARGTGELRIRPDDRVLATTDLTFDVSCFEIFATLLNGACLLLAQDSTLLDSKALENIVRERRVSVMWLSAGLFHQHAHLAPHLFAGLRVLIAGGDALSPRAVRAVLTEGRPGVFLNGYGPTENSSLSTVGRVDHLAPQAENVPIGVPVAGSTAYVVREDGTVAAPGETGELWVGGDGVALGYLGDPQKTAEHFIEDRWSPEGIRGRLYRTGDMARWREDGALEFLGRRDRQVKLRGYRVELDEVESVLSAHPHVRQTAVDVVGEGAGQRLVAAVVAHSGHRPKDLTARLHEHVRDRLPSYMVPTRIATVEALPLTSSGKVDRRSLSALAMPAAPAARDDAPRDEVEEVLAGVWRDILHEDTIGRDARFSALGGTSLRATQVTAAVRERLQVPAGFGRAMIRSLVADPSLRDFAASVRNLLEGHEEPGGADTDFAAESRLDPDLRFSAPAASAPRAPRQPLLTGATGFLGVYLVDRLLREGVERVHCLIRADDPQQALARLAARMRRYGLDPEPLLDRVVPVLGELAEPHFGLSEEDWGRLARETDSIVHCGARVNFAYPYRALAPINVDGTRTVLELAAEHSTKPLHHISTIAVIAGFGTAGVTHVDEQTPLDHADHLSLGYPETKWVAENLVVEAGRRGLPVAIHRPYEVTGTVDRGVWNTDTMMCALFRTIAETGLAPDMALPLDFVPVDYTADAITHIITHQEPDGRVYHLTNPHAARLPLLVERLTAMGYPVRTVSYDTWTEKLAELTARLPDHPMAPYIGMFIEPARHSEVSVKQMYTDGVFPTFGRHNTRSAIADSGLVCPPVDARLLDTYLGQFTRTGFLAPPPAPSRAAATTRKSA